MKKLFSVILIVLAFVMTTDYQLSAKTKIRVAYPLQEGLTEVSEDGVFSGYTYEYLKELERFTDYEFEFVLLDGDENAQITSAMKKVQEGDLDIMGAMMYDEALTDIYDYTSTNYGMGNMGIYVLSDNERINNTNIYSLKKLAVGIVSRQKKENEKLTEFGVMNGIDIKQHFYADAEAMLTALEKGKIESIAFSEQASVRGNYRMVATFAPRPFYFITTKGKTDVIAELNSAMTKLNKEQPSFMSELHEKYFSMKNADFTLTEKEQAFVDAHPEIDVAILGGNAPIQADSSLADGSGITIDILNYIGEEFGLKFTYHYTNSYEEYTKLLQDENVLLAGGVTDSYVVDRYDFTLSRSYLESQVQIVMQSGMKVDDLKGKRLALSRNLYHPERERNSVDYYDTALDCMKAVDAGKADYTYITSHTALFYNSVYRFDNILIIPAESSYKIKNCMAVRSHATPLVNIINKGIDNVTNEEIQSIIFKNGTYAREKPTLLEYIQGNPLQFISFLVIVAGLFIVFRFHMNKKSNEKIIHEYNRFQQICELSGDCFLEYDVQQDCLLLSGGSASLFSKRKSIAHFLSQKSAGWEIMQRILDHKETYDEETLVTYLDGTQRWQRVFLKPLYQEEAPVQYVIGKITDIQLQKEEQLLWKDMASRDSLTKLHNSAACREMIEDFLKNARDNELTFIILDVDDFKAINDTYGHLYGDQVLIKLAAALRSTTRSTDIAGRIGGDEFIVALKHPQSRQAVEQYCERLIKNITETQKHPLTISMGLAFYQKGQHYEELYQNADQALYKMKEEGRNGYRFAHEQ